MVWSQPGVTEAGAAAGGARREKKGRAMPRARQLRLFCEVSGPQPPPRPASALPADGVASEGRHGGGWRGDEGNEGQQAGAFFFSRNAKKRKTRKASKQRGRESPQRDARSGGAVTSSWLLEGGRRQKRGGKAAAGGASKNKKQKFCVFDAGFFSQRVSGRAWALALLLYTPGTLPKEANKLSLSLSKLSLSHQAKM